MKKTSFKRRLSYGLAVFVGLCSAAAIDRHTTRLAAQRRVQPVTAQPWRQPLRTWRDSVDPDRAVRQGDTLVQRTPDGAKVTYTLDPDLQAAAVNILKQYEVPYGAMVLFDLRSAELRVMAGYSKAQPELTSRYLCLHPWSPAASIFKLVTAAALLDKGVKSSARVCYHGGLHGLDMDNIEDNPRLDTTCRDLKDAVAFSVNPIIAKLALKHLTPQSLLKVAEGHGFNQPLSFEIPLPMSNAQIPHERLEQARVAAGFWQTEMSALHGAVIAAVTALDGQLLVPRLVKSVELPGGKIVKIATPKSTSAVSPVVAEQLAAMMHETVERGTGRQGFYTGRGQPYLPGLSVAGKTGSLAKQDPFVHYTWFVGFAPADKPEIAFAVVLGNPMEWRIKASTAARLLLTQYINNKSKKRTPEVSKAASKNLGAKKGASL